MAPVTYKKVLDKTGNITALELHQEGRYITISLAGKGTHKSYTRWAEIREVVDRLQENAPKEVIKDDLKEVFKNV